MNRLQKKCFVVSAGLHLLLPMILVFGSALTPKSKTAEDMPVLNFVALETNDKGMSGGGNPNVRTRPPEANKPSVPIPKPPAETPRNQPERPIEPEPQNKTVKTQDTESFEVTKNPPKRKLPDVPLRPKIRNNPSAPKLMAKNNVDDSSERLANERRKQLLNAIGTVANDLRENTSGTTDVKLFGPGGGGVPYADFLQAVRARYTQAWTVPDGVEDDEATTEVSVTIGRDGTVLRSSILRRSGNSLVDHSVQMTLDRVRFAAPLPKNAREDERTVTIGFNVKAKRGNG